MNLQYTYVNTYSKHISSDTTGGTGSKMGALFQDSNHADLVLTEGDDSGFCKSITSMTSSVSSAVPLGTSLLTSAKGNHFYYCWYVSYLPAKNTRYLYTE